MKSVVEVWRSPLYKTGKTVQYLLYISCQEKRCCRFAPVSHEMTTSTLLVSFICCSKNALKVPFSLPFRLKITCDAHNCRLLLMATKHGPPHKSHEMGIYHSLCAATIAACLLGRLASLCVSVFLPSWTWSWRRPWRP